MDPTEQALKMNTVKSRREKREAGGNRKQDRDIDKFQKLIGKNKHMLGLNHFRNNPDSEFQKNKTDCRISKSSRGKINPIKPHLKRYPQKSNGKKQTK